MSQSSQPATLVVGPAWVGDMVMAQSLFKLHQQQHPERAIDVLAPDWTQGLLARMPEVRKAVSLPLAHGQLGLGIRRQVAQDLKEQAYTNAIVLPNSWKSALVPWLADIPVRTGFIGEFRFGLLNDWRRLDRHKLYRTVDRFASLGLPRKAPLPSTIPQPALNVQTPQATLDEIELKTPERPLLGLCPGAEYGPAKRWPERHFAELARRHISQGGTVWVLGSDKDKVFGERIREFAAVDKTACVNLCGNTSLAQAIDLMSLCDAIVSNDSGLMHVAAALDKPLVAVYGSSDPEFTPPLNPRAQIVSLQLECSPCFARECPLAHTDCLNQLSPSTVEESLLKHHPFN
ncbi:MAG: lipopolysaccharide heptosyltransferase II [Pseudomonadota bacterium]